MHKELSSLRIKKKSKRKYKLRTWLLIKKTSAIGWCFICYLLPQSFTVHMTNYTKTNETTANINLNVCLFKNHLINLAFRFGTIYRYIKIVYRPASRTRSISYFTKEIYRCTDLIERLYLYISGYCTSGSSMYFHIIAANHVGNWKLHAHL